MTSHQHPVADLPIHKPTPRRRLRALLGVPFAVVFGVFMLFASAVPAGAASAGTVTVTVDAASSKQPGGRPGLRPGPYPRRPRPAIGVAVGDVDVARSTSPQSGRCADGKAGAALFTRPTRSYALCWGFLGHQAQLHEQ
jgi:hypothetical protein